MSEAERGYCQIALEPKLASTAAPDLYKQLTEHRQDTIVLDASKVEQIGVLCMQILASAAKTWQAEDTGFEVIDPSAAFLESVQLAGIDPALVGVETGGETTDAS